MEKKISFPIINEQYAVRVEGGGITAFLDFPAVISHLKGPMVKARYDTLQQQSDTTIATAHVKTKQDGSYTITDTWEIKDGLVCLNRAFLCNAASPGTALRLTSAFECALPHTKSFSDYQLMVPGAFYNKNDTDQDGADDYLGTFRQDYKDDRNPSLSVTCFSPKAGRFMALLRGDLPQRDITLTREQINARHFVHDTDIGSLGFSPSCQRTNQVELRCDYPFYERASFCLNVDASEWAAYKAVQAGTGFTASYLLLLGSATDLTSAIWQTTSLQMDRVLDDTVPLPFTLDEARKYRREMTFGSYREYPEKKGCPAGFFIHFSPRKRYADHAFLEYGFAGAQTLNAYAMLHAADEELGSEARERATKTLDFFVHHCIEPNGLPNGIYDAESEKFVYWWTGVLFPFLYSNNREELEKYLGEQVVASLMAIAKELDKVPGTYTRTMCEAMFYLFNSYLYEKEHGIDHPDWYQAVLKFCDKIVAIQNENGSWNRGYTMDGTPLTHPAEWFGASELEQSSGVSFPSQVLLTVYDLTGNDAYLAAARRAAHYILHTYVKDASYIGGLNDTTHKKSVKADAVGVMFAMRTMLMAYERCKDPELLTGARDAARVLASWTYMWNIPFDSTTLLGSNGFKTTGWAGCDVIPACSYVDDEFQEFIPDLLRIAEYTNDRKLATLAKIVTRGMQHGMSMPQCMYGYAMPGVQCEGYLTSLWLSDTSDREFSGAVAKNKGDDNDTCNGLVNGQALYNADYVMDRFGTLDFDAIIEKIIR